MNKDKDKDKDKENDITNLKYTLDKQIDWIKASDTKTSIFLTFLGLFLTFVINKFNIFDPIIKIRGYKIFNNFSDLAFIFCWISYMLFLILFFISICFLLFSLSPRLKNNTDYKSLIYFGNIVENNFDDLKKYYNDWNIYDDLINQIYNDSIIANKKMKNFNFGIKYFVISILLLSIYLLSEVFFKW